MPTLIVRGLRGELPPLVDPTIARDFVYIDDVCDAYLLAATRPTSEPGAIYNVGTGVQTIPRARWSTLARAHPANRDRTGVGLDAEPAVGHDDLGRRHSQNPRRTGMVTPLQSRPRISSYGRMVPEP